MSKQRIENEIGFILHTWPYRETSAILECFTEHYGRVSVVAKGAKRPYSAFRGLLQSFRPLQLSWSGSQELKTLHQADILGPHQMPVGLSWLCGCYLNELVLKLLGRYDPHPALFEEYRHIVEQLSTLSLKPSLSPIDYEVLLRQFEKALLREIGYAVNLAIDEEHNPVDPLRHYHVRMGSGTVELASNQDDCPAFLGQTLIDVENNVYDSAETRQSAKKIMRQLINYQLGGEVLRTRRLLVDLQRF